MADAPRGGAATGGARGGFGSRGDRGGDRGRGRGGRRGPVEVEIRAKRRNGSQ